MGLVSGFVFEDEQMYELGRVLDFMPGAIGPAPGLVLGDIPDELLDCGLHAVDGLWADLVVGCLIDRHRKLLGCFWSTMEGRPPAGQSFVDLAIDNAVEVVLPFLIVARSAAGSGPSTPIAQGTAAAYDLAASRYAAAAR